MSQLVAIVDQLLTNASNIYIPKGYISEELFPFIGVKNTTGKLAKYGTSHLRLENSVKAGRGKYRAVEPITRSTTSYQIDGHGLEGMVTKEDYANVIAPYDAERDETLGVSTLLWVEKEYVLAAALSDTAVITQNVTLTATQQYNDRLNSDPLSDFATARAAVFAGCGQEANVVWMSWAVKNQLRFHPQLLDAIGFKFARPGGLSDQELAQALMVDKVLIANAQYETAKEGQTSSLAAIWGKHLWFGCIPDAAAPYQVSAGYRIGYQGEAPRKVYKTNNFNPPGSTSILVEDNYDFLISNALAIYFIKNAVA